MAVCSKECGQERNPPPEKEERVKIFRHMAEIWKRQRGTCPRLLQQQSMAAYVTGRRDLTSTQAQINFSETDDVGTHPLNIRVLYHYKLQESVADLGDN